MRRLHATPCKLDRDYVRFTRYYIAHSHQFEDQYSFHDAIAHLVVSLRESQFMLFDDKDGHLQAYMQYRYEAGDHTVLIESAILSAAYRSSLVFYRGFADWARYVMTEWQDTRMVRFHARADNLYLSRLYAKFAKRIGERESFGRTEIVYETSFDELLQYLRVAAPTNVEANALILSKGGDSQ